jgi:hypothetical protein
MDGYKIIFLTQSDILNWNCWWKLASKFAFFVRNCIVKIFMSLNLEI